MNSLGGTDMLEVIATDSMACRFIFLFQFLVAFFGPSVFLRYDFLPSCSGQLLLCCVVIMDSTPLKRKSKINELFLH